MKYEYLSMEEEDIRAELSQYISDFDERFKKYYSQSSKEEKSVWVNEETGEVRNEPPPIDLDEKIKEEEIKKKQRRISKLQSKKKMSPKMKSLYKKLSSITHPDRGGNSEDFLTLKEAYEDNDLVVLLKFADKYNVEYELEEDDSDVIEEKTKQLENEIKRMKSTLAWYWGTTDLKGKLQVIRQVERETKATVKVDDYPDELKPDPPKEIKLLSN